MNNYGFHLRILYCELKSSWAETGSKNMTINQLTFVILHSRRWLPLLQL